MLDGESVYMEYAAPADVPRLMDRWLMDFNKTRAINCPAQAVATYVRTHMVFVRIHPFFDGNGRMARLIANLPVLAAGFPPILMPMSRRADYIDILWRYQNAVGRIGRASRLLPPHPALRDFESLLLRNGKIDINRRRSPPTRKKAPSLSAAPPFRLRSTLVTIKIQYNR